MAVTLVNTVLLQGIRLASAATARFSTASNTEDDTQQGRRLRGCSGRAESAAWGPSKAAGQCCVGLAPCSRFSRER